MNKKIGKITYFEVGIFTYILLRKHSTNLYSKGTQRF